MDKYLEKLPLDAQYLYMRPLDKIPTTPTKPWYTKQRVGYNTLIAFILKLFAGSQTNHLLRATSITRMFKVNAPEMITAEMSGDKSLKTLRMYEHTSFMQEKATGVVILEGGQFSCSGGKSDPSETERLEKTDTWM